MLRHCQLTSRQPSATTVGLSSLREEENAGLDRERAAQPQLLRSWVGTHAYMAPEMLRHERYGGEAVDVWACGMVIFIMLAGFPPLMKADVSDWYYKRLHKVG